MQARCCSPAGAGSRAHSPPATLLAPLGLALHGRARTAGCPKPSSSLTRHEVDLAQHPATTARGNWDRAALVSAAPTAVLTLQLPSDASAKRVRAPAGDLPAHGSLPVPPRVPGALRGGARQRELLAARRGASLKAGIQALQLRSCCWQPELRHRGCVVGSGELL